MALLIDLIAQERAAPVEIANLKPAFELLLKQFDPKRVAKDIDPEVKRRPAIEEIGRAAAAVWKDIAEQITFIGELSAALFYALQQSEGWPDLRRMVNPTLALAFQSLRTQTPNDLHTVFTHNRTNLARHLDGMISVLSELRAALAAGDSDKLEAFLLLVGRQWENWDGRRHSGKWNEAPEIEKLPGLLASMGGFLTMPRKKQGDDED